MKVLGIFEVDEAKLAETGHTFDEEMGWVAQSGITLIQSVKATRESYEYAAFVWNTRREEYEQIGRPVETELLCRNRFKEYVDKGWLMDCYDTSKVVFKKRNTVMFEDIWEEIKEAEEDGEK